VLGDPVNLAARLESQSKNYGVKIVVGPQTAETGKDRFALLQLDLIQVKGQSVGVDIYALLGDAEYAAQPDFVAIKEKHDAMIEAYRTQHWDDAEELLAECRKLTDGELSVLYDLYRERIEYYQEVPPPIDWDGVYVAETK
jgi:adenylate cyclase